MVALPLALAFSVATGVGAAPGLITAVVAGFVAACFGGSRVQVTGPTGAMTVVLVPLVASHGRSVIYPIAVLAGAMVLAGALLRLGRLLAYVPWPVIEGFTVGIAVIIAAQQVPNALGVPKPHIDNAAAAGAVGVARFLQHPRWITVGLLLVAVLFTWGLPRLHRSLPASLGAVLVVSAIVGIGHLDVGLIGSLPSGIPAPALPNLHNVGSLLKPALVVALLASLESLLSARVADGMSDGPRHEPDRELFGQGLANIAAGLFGGMPATGAIARTAVNARAGARTRVSAMVHSLVLAIMLYAASGLVGRIPLVALAGVLLVTAARMVERHNVLAVLRATRTDAVVLVLTAAATIALDLITAVEVGIGVAVLLTVVRMSRTARATAEPLEASELDSDEEHALLAEQILIYRLDGPLFFGAAQRFLTELTAVSDVRVLILRLSSMDLLDATGAKALGEIVNELQGRGITVLMKGAHAEHNRILAAVGALEPVLALHHVFTDLPAALSHARRHLAATAVTG